MLSSDLELATVIEIRCHQAAGYSATAHNKAFFTKLMKASYITALATSWDTPSRLPVERYQAASTDADTWPNWDAFRNCSNAALCCSNRKYISSLIAPGQWQYYICLDVKIEPHSSMVCPGSSHWDDKLPGCTSHHHSHLKQLVGSISLHFCGRSIQSHSTSPSHSRH